MKISKTSANSVTDRKVESVKKTGKKGKSAKTAGGKSGSGEDTVSLSADALAASEASGVEETGEVTGIDGPLPDPIKTSEAIINKELRDPQSS